MSTANTIERLKRPTAGLTPAVAAEIERQKRMKRELEHQVKEFLQRKGLNRQLDSQAALRTLNANLEYLRTSTSSGLHTVKVSKRATDWIEKRFILARYGNRRKYTIDSQQGA